MSFYLVFRGNENYNFLFENNAGKNINTIFDDVELFEASNEGYNVNPELGVASHLVDDCSAGFTLKKTRVKEDLLEYLYKSAKWSPYMFSVTLNREVVPFLMMKCSATLSAGDEKLKRRLANKILVDFCCDLKRQKPLTSDENCPYFMPSTQNTYVRTLLTSLGESYGWHYSLDRDFNYKGGLKKVLSALYQTRGKKFKSYGTSRKKYSLSETDYNKLYKGFVDRFDEDNPKDHMMKVLLACGKIIICFFYFKVYTNIFLF